MGYGWLRTIQNYHQCLLQGSVIFIIILSQKGADGIVIVYDVTNKQSFEDVDKFWLNEVESYGEKNV